MTVQTYRAVMAGLMCDERLHERLRRWTTDENVRLEREEYVYALLWADQAGTLCLIEVSFAANGVAARTGIVRGAPDGKVRLDPDKRAMTSWHCAPYARLEELLHELRSAHAKRTTTPAP